MPKTQHSYEMEKEIWIKILFNIFFIPINKVCML